LQIEVNRALYMDEERIERRPRLARLAAEMEGLIAAIAALDGAELAA
jgi:N-formylglutamate amidohydrolase